MLFPYTYVPHQMDKMQEFVDFIFHEVWCKAPASGSFDFSLFDANTDLQEVVEAFHYSDSNGAYFFNSHIERIYENFAKLTPGQIRQFQHWYQGNNDLESVCSNDPATQLARYSDIAAVHSALAGQLKTFFKELYSPALLNLVALRNKIGRIDDHYHAFVAINKTGVCPFCGINDLLGEYHSKREAYDHYLPKAHYPFNSINFKNLIPACHHCNSSYKTSKDPTYTPKDPTRASHRRAIFYPYTTTPYTIQLQVTLEHSDIENLNSSDVNLQFGPISLDEKIDTWKDVYGIEERYKAKLCGENGGKYWLIQVLDEWTQDGRDPITYLAALERQAHNHPHAECNFLKKPFLDVCYENGLFSENSQLD